MKKILIGLGIFISIVVVLFVLLIINTYSQYKKLEYADIENGFSCDTIPFTYSGSGHILVKVKVNDSDEDYLFILDSGASNIIFSNYSGHKSLESNGFGISVGANKNIFFTRTKKISSLQIGDANFKNVSAKETNLNFDCMDNVCGLIGTGVMRHLVWTIDFQRQIIVISKNIQEEEMPKGRIDISLRENRFSHHLSTDIKFRNNKKAKNVLVDLGCGTTLFLSENTILEDSLDLKFKNNLGCGSKGLGENTNLNLSEKYYLLDSLIFGKSGYFVNNIPVMTSKKGINLLGVEFFKKYKTTISWMDKKLILTPNDSIQNFIWKTHGLTTGFDKSKRVEIQSIVEDSPASRSKVPLKAEVLSVNEMQIDSTSYCNLRKIIEESDTIRLKIFHNDSVKVYSLSKEFLFE